MLERQAAKEGLLQMLDSKQLPPVQSEDRRLLFTLDPPNTLSRLLEQMPDDCVCADSTLWDAWAMPDDCEVLLHKLSMAPWLSPLLQA